MERSRCPNCAAWREVNGEMMVLCPRCCNAAQPRVLVTRIMIARSWFWGALAYLILGPLMLVVWWREKHGDHI